MRVDFNSTFDALLAAICPRIAAHPLSLAFTAPKFTKAPFLALVRGEAFSFGAGLERVRTKFNSHFPFIQTMFKEIFITLPKLEGKHSTYFLRKKKDL